MPDRLILSDGVIKKEIGPMPEFNDDYQTLLGQSHLITSKI